MQNKSQFNHKYVWNLREGEGIYSEIFLIQKFTYYYHFLCHFLAYFHLDSFLSLEEILEKKAYTLLS